MHFDSEWVQGAMRIARPYKLEIEYTRNMMCWQEHLASATDQPAHIVQLGLGAASLTKYCYRHYPQARITAVEINPQVVAACRQFFKLPLQDERFKVLIADAGAWVADARNHATVDVLQVDLYDALARGPVLDSVAFYSDCRACLITHGMMTVNVFGNGAGFEASYAAIAAAFDGQCTAMAQVDAGNRIILAMNRVT